MSNRRRPDHRAGDHRHSLACIVPPDLLRDIIRDGTKEERDAAADTLAIDQTFRTLRAAFEAIRRTKPV